MMELDVALAIALTLLLLSTLASMLVEIIFKSLNMRKKDLQLMLKNYLLKHLTQEVVSWHNSTGAKFSTQNTKESTQNTSTEKNNISPTDPEISQAVSALVYQILPEKAKERLTATEFMHRLGETELGKTFYDKSGNQLNDALTYLVNKYEEAGNATSRLFRTKSFWLTGIIGVVIAFILNVNIFSLGSDYASNQKLRLSMINKAENIETMATIQMHRIENSEPNDKASVAEIKQSLGEFKAQLKEVNTYGIPMGYGEGRTPNQLFAETFQINNEDVNSALSAFIWFISTTLTGVLIGLGSPFWFDVVKKLSVVREYVGVMRPKQGSVTPQNQQSNQTKASAPLALDNDPVIAFKESIETKQALANVRSGKAVLKQSLSTPTQKED
jgi:hypothetical protein